MTPTSGAPRWVTVRAVAQFLSVTTSWVYSRTYRGASDPLPYKRVGKWLRFDLDEVARWVDERTATERDERASERAEWSQPNGQDATPASSSGSPLPFRIAPKTTGPRRK